jgi:hypothetical protein
MGFQVLHGMSPTGLTRTTPTCFLRMRVSHLVKDRAGGREKAVDALGFPIGF